ncbi:serine protease [Candidatus Nomurabacteria bacterium]|nr:serine protease [Candidatus Nomurabacteria bacterium]
MEIDKNSHHPHFERPTNIKPPSMFSLIILAAIIGLLAGGAGYWLTQSLVTSDSIYAGFTNFNNRVNVNIDQPLTDLAQKYSSSVAGVYQKTAKLVSLDNPVFDQKDYLGAATVITSDGWLMTTDQVTKSKEVMLVLGDNVYSPTEIKFDSFSGLAFLKIEASFLSPIDFQLAENYQAGERLFTNLDLAQSSSDYFHTAFLSDRHYVADKFLTTDQVDFYLKTDEANLSLNLLGAPYFNLKGDVLGVAYSFNQDLVLIPAKYLKQAVKHLLDGTERVTMGLRYLDFENNAGFLEKGHLIYHPTLAAVERNSAAFKAGIKAGDQIVAVNNSLISEEQSLTAILQNYRLGDKVILRILRDRVEQDIEVQL